MIRSFTFAGKDLYKDFGCYVDGYEEGTPQKKTIKASIPYRSGSLDFSEMYGEDAYDDRLVKYTVDVVEDDESRLEITKTALIDWLLGAPKGEIIDNASPGYHYVGKCISVSGTDEVEKSTLTITFDCYPFKIKNVEEGDVIWDDFCFLTDVWNTVSYQAVDEEQEVMIVNSGINAQYVDIEVTGNVRIVHEKLQKDWTDGRYAEAYLMRRGENTFTIRGDGTIRFIFHIEKL